MQALVLVKDFDTLTPVVFTFSGLATRYFSNTLNAFRQQVIAPASALAKRKFPLYAFWVPVKAGEQVEVGKQSASIFITLPLVSLLSTVLAYLLATLVRPPLELCPYSILEGLTGQVSQFTVPTRRNRASPPSRVGGRSRQLWSEHLVGHKAHHRYPRRWATSLDGRFTAPTPQTTPSQYPRRWATSLDQNRHPAVYAETRSQYPRRWATSLDSVASNCTDRTVRVSIPSQVGNLFGPSLKRSTTWIVGSQYPRRWATSLDLLEDDGFVSYNDVSIPSQVGNLFGPVAEGTWRLCGRASQYPRRWATSLDVAVRDNQRTDNCVSIPWYNQIHNMGVQRQL